MWCISLTYFYFLVNGTPFNYVQSFKGLRQGNPLSPYLRILTMEMLSNIFNRQKKGASSWVMWFVEDEMWE